MCKYVCSMSASTCTHTKLLFIFSKTLEKWLRLAEFYLMIESPNQYTPHLQFFFQYTTALKAKVVPEGWAVIVTAQPSGTTLLKAGLHVF